MDDCHDVTEVDGLVKVTVSGVLDEPQAIALSEDLKSQLGTHAAGKRVLLNLDGLEKCTIIARSTLADLQAEIGKLGVRSAYVSTRPRWRGLGLWICHVAEDDNAQVLPTEEAGIDWLRGSENRLDALERLERNLARMKEGGKR